MTESILQKSGSERRAIFREVLGELFGELPGCIQSLHSGQSRSEWRGRATVRGGQGLLGRAVARVFGFPCANDETGVHVSITSNDRGETWVRTFGTQVFKSELTLGDGRDQGLLRERFGMVSISIELLWKDGKLWYVPRRWCLGPIPLPSFLMPVGDSFESERDGEFGFDVTVAAPVVGSIVAYRGTLRKVE